MSDTTAYYIAGGKSLAAIEDYFARRKAAHKKHREFANRFGVNEWQLGKLGGASFSFAGLMFKDEKSVPTGWKKYKHRGVTQDFYVPSGNNKARRALLAEMDSLGVDGPGEDAGHKFFEYGSDGFRLHHNGFEKIGARYIIKQHEKAKPPTDAIPMKRSEYWKLVERRK